MSATTSGGSREHGGGSGAEEGDDNEDDSDSSSSSSATAVKNDSNLQTVLESFRNEWRNELEDRKRKARSLNNGRQRHDSRSNRREAATKRIEQLEKLFVESESSEDEGDVNNEERDQNLSEDAEDLGDLVARFRQANIDDCGNPYLCRSETEQFMAHISVLPYEVIIYLLKWVVTNELDLRSLEQFSTACRGFYVAARDSELWRLACEKIWPSKTSIKHHQDTKWGKLISPSRNSAIYLEEAKWSQSQGPQGPDWRSMFIERVRLNLNGAYISRTSYIRQGESSFQDVTYRPCFIIQYYRYLRFFPDGRVLMLTTPDEPYVSLPKLRQKHPSIHHSTSILTGHYVMTGNLVSATLKKAYTYDNNNQSRRYKRRTNQDDQNNNSAASQVFNITLELRTVKGRRNCQLIWQSYSVDYHRANGQIASCPFELSANNFPPFWFSIVRSYSAFAECALN